MLKSTTTAQPALSSKFYPIALTIIGMAASSPGWAQDLVLDATTDASGGDFSISGVNDVTQTGPLIISGRTVIAIAGHANLSNAANDFVGGVLVSGASYLTLSNQGALYIHEMNVTNDASIDAGGVVTQLGAISARELAITAGADVTLTSASNAVTRLGVVDVSGNFSFTNSQALQVKSTLDASTVTFGGSSTVTVTDAGVITTTQVTRNAGVLVVDGTIDGAVRISSGATLAGSGTVGDTEIQSGGTLAAGNSIGTLDVDGDLILADDAAFLIEVDPAGTDADLVAVTGNVTINGGTVRHIGEAGPYGLRSTYTILTADGSLTGSFDGATSDYAFLVPELIYERDMGVAERSVQLELVRNDVAFVTAAATANQQATATAIDSIGIGAANPVYDAVALLPDNDAVIQAAFDQLSGEVTASLQGAFLSNGQHVRGSIYDRLAAAPDAGTVYWVDGFGAWSENTGDGNASSTDHWAGAVLFGADVTEGATTFGAYAGYGQTSLGLAGGSAASDDFHLGAYGAATWGDASLRAGLSHALHNVSTSRPVDIAGLTDELEAGYLAGTTQAYAELSYTLDANGLALEPFIGITAIGHANEAFTEDGGPAALSVESGTDIMGFADLGLRAAHQFDAGGVDAHLRGMLGWRHLVGDASPEVEQAFAEGDAFTVAGNSLARDQLLLGAGFAVYLGGAQLELDYTGQLANGAATHAVGVGLSGTF